MRVPKEELKRCIERLVEVFPDYGIVLLVLPGDSDLAVVSNMDIGGVRFTLAAGMEGLPEEEIHGQVH